MKINSSRKCPNCSSAEKTTLLYPSVNKFKIFICHNCRNGYTYPVPSNISKYYHSNYWITPGILGKIKNLVFKVFQARRDKWLKKYLIKGRILEIGSGEGNFANALKGNYEITCIEHPGAKINNRKVLKVDFLKWKTHKKFDGVFFWESLEHVPTPVEYLKKSFNLLTDNGFLFIELPRFDCLESRIFKKHWFHLDPPRHLVHITSSGLDGLFSRSGFMKIEKKDVFAVEYVLWGFLESFLDIIGIKSTDYFKKSKFPFFLLFLFPILAFATVAELFFFLIKESPINFVVARKRNG